MSVPHAFRYPGSKTKLVKQIIPIFPDYFWGDDLLAQHPTAEYREPFFGAGAIGLRVLYAMAPGMKAWINDADVGVSNYWKSVQTQPEDLIARVEACETPTIRFYRECLAKSSDHELDMVESGFITLLLHQCSYSGLGKKAGSPIGGWNEDQTGKTYRINCRWKPQTIIKDIRACHQHFRRLDLTITHGDFEPVFQDISYPEHTFFYCDPPYVKRGPELYAESMDKADHERLSILLHHLKSPWVLSYDEDPLVRSLYDDCNVTPLNVGYTVTNGVGRALTKVIPPSHELLITPKPTPRVKHGSALVVTGKTGYSWEALAQEMGKSVATVRNRVRRGWTLEEIRSTPQRQHTRLQRTIP